MDNLPKESYRIGKILKKLTGIKFIKSRQTSDISKNGANQSTAYQQKKKPSQSINKPVEGNPPTAHEDKFVRYQKELEASKLMAGKAKPKSPGRIPKLTTGRKEIMSISEE